jgi:hypothetical protein
VAFLKSLICISGCDNGRRYLMISVIAYFLGITLAAALKNPPGISIILLLLVGAGLAMASIRRVRDAEFNLWLAAIPSAFFILTCLSLGLFDNWFKYLLVFFSVLICVAFGLLSNAKKRRVREYQYGYNGPAFSDLNRDPAPLETFSRIEPNLDVEQVSAIDSDSPQDFIDSTEELATFEATRSPDNYDTAYTASPMQQSSAWQNFNFWLNQNLKVAFAALGALIIFSLVIVSFIQPTTKAPEKVAHNTQLIEQKQRLNKIKMPDNYWLMFDQHQALTIAWQGDFGEDQVIWTAATAQGDESCAKIRFENGESYRLLTATRKNSGDYYADFSPLDSQKLVKAIALRSRFKLCGYEFSLKGTQAILMANKAYSAFIQS